MVSPFPSWTSMNLAYFFRLANVLPKEWKIYEITWLFSGLMDGACHCQYTPNLLMSSRLAWPILPLQMQSNYHAAEETEEGKDVMYPVSGSESLNSEPKHIYTASEAGRSSLTPSLFHVVRGDRRRSGGDVIHYQIGTSTPNIQTSSWLARRVDVH